MVSLSSFLSKQSLRSVTPRVGNNGAVLPFQVISGSIRHSKDHRAVAMEKIQQSSVSCSISEVLACFSSLIRQECCYKNVLWSLQCP